MSSLPQHLIRIADLTARKAHHFDLTPDAQACAALAQALDISALRKLRLQGRLAPLGKTDWRLEAQLGATAIQECVVSLAPVTTRLDDEITRVYAADFQEPEAAEAEMTDDTDTDPLPEAIDLYQIVHESLLLALPDFPRADGAALGETVVTEPGVAPMRDEDAKPFAGLAALRDQLRNDEDGS